MNNKIILEYLYELAKARKQEDKILGELYEKIKQEELKK